MRIQGGPRAPVPLQAPVDVGPQQKAARVAKPAVVGSVDHFGTAVPASHPTALAGLARAATMSSGRLERGAKQPIASEAAGADAAETRDVADAHPLYGRYARQWTARGGAAEPGQKFLSMMQTQLQDLQQTMRSVR